MANEAEVRRIVNNLLQLETSQNYTLGPGGMFNVNGQADALVIDDDGDTTISAPTDDQIDIEIAGADDFTFTADSFNVLTGSAIDLADSCQVKFGTGDDITMAWDGTDFDVLAAGANSSIKWGVDDAGIDQVWYGDTASSVMTWDQSADQLDLNGADIRLQDSDELRFGDATGGDVQMSFNATDFVINNAGGTIQVNWASATGLELDDAAISGYAGAADTAARDVFIETADGGAASADTSGVAGGDFSLKAGDGSAGGAHTSNNPNGGDAGSITLTAGAGGAAGAGGSGVAGDPGAVQLGASTLFKFAAAQVIDMADAAVTLTRNPGTPAGTVLSSNVLRVDANSGATENLLLPPEADCAGVLLLIVNTGGESIVVQNDAAATIDTVATAEFGIFFCDGTAWSGMNQA